MDAFTRELVRRRTDHRCAYYLLRQEHSDLTHHVEHIVARQHRGPDDPDNLALSCHRCNLHKGPNLSGIDPASGNHVPLFHPRRDRWADHFTFRGARIEGLTPVGRATVEVLAMNDARRLGLRAELLARGEVGLTCSPRDADGRKGGDGPENRIDTDFAENRIDTDFARRRPARSGERAAR